MGAPVSLIQNNSGHLKYLSRAVSYRHNPEDAVQNGRRHVDVNLLGMWWSPPRRGPSFARNAAVEA